MTRTIAPSPIAQTTEELAAQAKLALRRMAKSVTVITCRHEGVRYAMAATAADALSMDPPSMIVRSEEHTSELQSLMRISYAVFCLKKKIQAYTTNTSFEEHTTIQYR